VVLGVGENVIGRIPRNLGRPFIMRCMGRHEGWQRLSPGKPSYPKSRINVYRDVRKLSR
jgi:hypothetical protein